MKLLNAFLLSIFIITNLSASDFSSLETKSQENIVNTAKKNSEKIDDIINSNKEILFTIGFAFIVLLVSSLIILKKNRELSILTKTMKEYNSELKLKLKDAIHKIEKQHQANQDNAIKNVKFTTIGQMAAGIIHEINTPLTYIKGTLEASIIDIDKINVSNIDKKKDILNKDFKRVFSGIERMELIIESMREISQVADQERKNINIYGTIITVLRILNNRLNQTAKIYVNGEKYDNSTSDKDRYRYIAYGHMQRLEQVWTIVLNNAMDELVKVQGFAKRRIDIEIEEDDIDVVVTISDNAGGIDQSILKDLFEPFVSTKVSSGVGIGLNVAKKIIDDHDGQISAYNIDNKAFFVIKIPKKDK